MSARPLRRLRSAPVASTPDADPHWVRSHRNGILQAIRRFILKCAALGFRSVATPAGGEPKTVVVVRIDERVGNVVMTTPLFAALRAQFPGARLAALVSPRGSDVVAGHPNVDVVRVFRKRRWLDAHGPIGTLWWLRRNRFDWAVNAGSVRDPSVTHTLLTLFSGARYTVGPRDPATPLPYSAERTIAVDQHEVRQRLQLLEGLPAIDHWPARYPLSLPNFGNGRSRASVRQFLEDLEDTPRWALNLGGRTIEKRLTLAHYVLFLETLPDELARPIITYGPAETELASALARAWPRGRCAPDTTLPELSLLFGRMHAVVSVDTGPMHLAVATGVPTCGLFVTTDPRWYGYAHEPHCAVSVDEEGWPQRVAAWLSARASGRPSTKT